MVELIRKDDVQKILEARLARHQAGLDLINSDGEDPLNLREIIPVRIKELLAIRTELSRIPSVKEEC